MPSTDAKTDPQANQRFAKTTRFFAPRGEMIWARRLSRMDVAGARVPLGRQAGTRASCRLRLCEPVERRRYLECHFDPKSNAAAGGIAHASGPPEMLTGSALSETWPPGQ